MCSELKELACKLAGMTEEEMQRYIAGHNSGEAQGKVHFRIDGEENSSEELFLSLQNKKGKDYYDTVTEIARRVAEGKARLTSLPEEYERKGVLSTPHAAARIIASAWVRERNGSSESIKRRNNDNGAVSVRLDKDGRDSSEVQIETWAKQNGCWIDENDYISKEYQTSHGDEARVYFVGNKVVKFADYKKLHGEDGISSYLDRITLMNTIDPEAALKIIGFGRDKDGKFRVVLEQKKFAKTFNFEHDDDWNITAIGNKQISDFYNNDAPIIKRQFAKKGIEYDPNDWISYYKNEIEISDVGMTNIAKDENGRYHFIDVTARVLRQGKEESSDKPMLIDNIAAKNDNALGEPHFRSEDAEVTSISKDAPMVVKHIAEVSKKVGAKVNMVQSAEEVTNPEVKKALNEGKKVTGWYDEKTGEVHLYMPNIHDRYTAEKTIWHETVGHKGMRGLMGEHFDKFLRDVWYDLDKPENAVLKKLVDEERRRNPLNDLRIAFLVSLNKKKMTANPFFIGNCSH